MKNCPPNPSVVGDCIELSLRSGRAVQGVIRAVVSTTSSWTFNVAIGSDQAAIELWQIIKKLPRREETK